MIDVFISILLVLVIFLGGTIYLSYINSSLKGWIDVNITDVMDPESSARYLKRKVKSGHIDVHPTERALVLKYELEFQILTEKGDELYKEKRHLEKIINLTTLNTKTDSNSLAKAVVEKCELIHPSKLAEVEQLVYYLKKRKATKTDGGSRASSSLSAKSNSSDTNKTESASILMVDEYIELLYEDVAEKIKGSALILQLAREPSNLDCLSKNEAVLSALARVLREDWKKSIVLSTNLIYTFFCFSTYRDFHPLILHYKIGSLCMDIIDFELSRYDEWHSELIEAELPPHEKTRKSCPNSASMSEIPRSKIPEPVRPRSGNWSDAFANSKLIMNGSVYDDLSNSADNLEEKRDKLSDVEKAKRYRTLMKKQEQLLRVAFYLLLNISEDENVEEKMIKKNIVGMLVKTLERDNEDLLILVVTFLKKLSVFEVNKELMVELDVVDKLPNLLESANPDLVHLTLKLLFNLSFDEEIRSKMVKCGFLPKFVGLLSDDRHQDVIIKLLYHLSMNDKVRVMFSHTDCVSLIIDMILLSRDDTTDTEMIALGINLAIEEKNANQMIENNRLHNLMSRAFKFQHYLLMKMIRNISEHKKIQPNFLEFVGDLAGALVESKKDTFIIECLGVLGNIWLPDLDYSQIFHHFKLISFFRDILKPKAHEDDLVLDAIVFIGTAVQDKECAQLICESKILELFIDLLKEYQEDDEIVCQIIFVFLQVLNHDETKDYVILETDAPGYFIDLLQDQNKVVSRLCDTCLTIIGARNPDWARRIQIEKFRNHNAQWLQMVESHAVDNADYEEVLDELPPYLNPEFLATHSVPTFQDENGDADDSLNDDDNLGIFEDLDDNRMGHDLDLEFR